MDYLAMRDLSQAQLQAEGGVLVLKRKPQQAYDPTTGTVGTPPVLPDLNFYGVQMSLDESYIDGKVRQWSDHFRSGTLIQEAKLKLFVSAGYVTGNTVSYDVTPVKGDRIETMSQEFTILDIGFVAPSGLTIAYEITLG